MSRNDLRETPQLFMQTARQVIALVQGELKLAKAEIAANLSRAGVGLVFFVVAALLSLVAFNLMASALVAYIAAKGLSSGTAAVIVAGALLLVAVIFAVAGKRRISVDALAPRRTVRNVKRDLEHIKESTHVQS